MTNFNDEISYETATPFTSAQEAPTKRTDDLRLRAESDYRALTQLGLHTGETYFPPGTAIQSHAIRRARTAFNALPDAHSALESLADTVEAEDRTDIELKLADSEMTPCPWGGFWIGARGTVVSPTETAMKQLLAKYPGGAAAPSDLQAWWTQVTPHDVKLRTRKLPTSRDGLKADRELYAVVSPAYVNYDLDAVADDLTRVVPTHSRARIRYTGARARIDVILQNPYMLSDGTTAGGVGETHRIVLRCATADNGTGGYKLSLLAERARCINLTLLHSSKSLFRGTHRQSNLRDLVQRAIDEVEPLMASFASTWESGWNTYYTERYSRATLSGADALARIVQSGKFRIPGQGTDGTLARCLEALAEEPGDSKVHVHNAMTRAAHMAPVTSRSVWADDDAEEMASALLYQTVNVLNPLEA